MALWDLNPCTACKDTPRVHMHSPGLYIAECPNLNEAKELHDSAPEYKRVFAFIGESRGSAIIKWNLVHSEVS